MKTMLYSWKHWEKLVSYLELELFCQTLKLSHSEKQIKQYQETCCHVSKILQLGHVIELNHNQPAATRNCGDFDPGL